jgi:hypothetical protein
MMAALIAMPALHWPQLTTDRVSDDDYCCCNVPIPAPPAEWTVRIQQLVTATSVRLGECSYNPMAVQ